MKWINKGNEELLGDFNMTYIDNVKKFCIYGAGKLGGDLYKTLKHYGLFDCFIDNNRELQEIGYKDEIVLSEESYFNKNTGSIIIICVSSKNCFIIEDNLKRRGLVHNKDYYIYKDFIDKILPVLVYRKFNQLFMNLAQICVTERCTLKCKKCAHGCYNVSSLKEDMTLDQVKESADIFFSKVDYIHEFVLIGGEPMLYKNLYDAIKYIGNKYRNRMNIFSITTNGTIMPSQELMRQCKEQDVLIRVSNYSSTLSKLVVQYSKLEKLFIENNIQFRMGKKESEWMDYGFDNYKRTCNNAQLIEVFDACRTPCHEIRENEFYYCVMARSVAENLNFNVGKEDYLDFNELTSDNWKRELLEFLLGYSEKGYLEMCRYCHGAEVDKYVIPAAEQVER